MAESIPEKDQFLTAYPNYVLRETVTYPNGGVSRFYDDGVDMVIIDDKICSCRDGEQIFPYTLITDKQNHYMKIYRRVFRFLGFDPETIEKCLRKSRQEVLHSTKKISERGEYADSSPLELLFEQNFTDVYGMRALKYLQKEFRISDEDGNNYFLDYLVDTADSRVAIEENGIHYHHPQLIGIEGYRKQLRKQNTCALWGLKLYRFSTEDCRFKDRIEDDIRSYLGKDTGGFREAGLLLERKTELYEHQEISLAQIEERREKGIRAFLIVLPTAAGKSRIVEEDIQKFAAGKEQFRVLILAPNTNIIADWKERIDKDLQPLQDRIDIKTYSYAVRHYHEKTRDYYSYIVVDEVHHAVAPMLKRVIQYYAPEFLVGLTATDQRPDKKRLEEIFGNYTTELSLKDAMEKGVVARANVYRIETNIDLSHVRFNGKDYVNADLEKSVRVTSRNELIVNVLKDYFTEGDAGKRQGIIFCINKAHIQIVRHMIDNRLHYSNRGIPVLCPMYLYEDGKAKPNVNSEMVSMITEKTGISFSESLVESETEFDIMDLFDYSYGILNSPLYIEKYIDLLKIEFPKVPIPNGNEMFWRIVAYGRRLRKLHLLEEDIGNPMGISFEGVGDNIVSSRKLKPEGLYINRTQLFTNVTEEIWDFCYGGYHGLQKWFKDRNGMKLSEDDIQHVIRVLNVFEKTISIREDLDICMDEFGLI